MNVDYFLEKNLIPDFLIRLKIRQLLKQRLRGEDRGSEEENKKRLLETIEELNNSPVAVETRAANEQHYEVPAEFYQLVLGKHLKYSSCYYKESTTRLNTAEQDMLELTCERAGLGNGQDILELGCGWGSLSLYAAGKFPDARITAVSNSRTQKLFIDQEVRKRGITNLTSITCDMNTFNAGKAFDRVVSVEMFEHMRNYRELMKRIAGWMKPDARLFVHIFTHKKFTYKFEVKDESDWMSRYFFTGGIMPSNELLLYFNEDLVKENSWTVNGMHYSKTAEAWLKNMDKNKNRILPILAGTYGNGHTLKWYVYWKIFFMACSELWKFNKGNEWMVSHYLFRKK